MNLGTLIVAAVLLVPAIGAWFTALKILDALKKREKKWAVSTATGAFIGTYLLIVFALTVALAFSGLFHR